MTQPLKMSKYDRLTQSETEYLLITINNYGRRIAYEEFKSRWRIPLEVHDVRVFNKWEQFIKVMEKRGQI